MTKAEIFSMVFKCPNCKFELILSGTKECAMHTIKILINNHKNYNSECKSEKASDFIVNNINLKNKYNLEVKKIIDTRIEETEKIINDILNNDIKCNNSSYIDNIISPFNNYSNDKDYQYIGIVLIRDISIASQSIIKIIVSILNRNKNFINNYNYLILNINDFISTRSLGESELKIQSIFSTIKNLRDNNQKKTFLIINDVDNLTTDKNTRLDYEKINSFVSEFEKVYNDKSMFIVGIGSHLGKIKFMENRFEVAKFV